MSSPLGGFYLSAAQRKQKAKFELSNRTQIRLDIGLENKQSVLLTDSRKMYVGEEQEFTHGELTITVNTTILDSGLLSVVCKIKGNNFVGEQGFNLSPNETISSLVEANEQMKMTVLASSL